MSLGCDVFCVPMLGDEFFVCPSLSLSYGWFVLCVYAFVWVKARERCCALLLVELYLRARILIIRIGERVFIAVIHFCDYTHW